MNNIIRKDNKTTLTKTDKYICNALSRIIRIMPKNIHTLFLMK